VSVLVGCRRCDRLGVVRVINTHFSFCGNGYREEDDRLFVLVCISHRTNMQAHNHYHHSPVARISSPVATSKVALQGLYENGTLALRLIHSRLLYLGTARYRADCVVHGGRCVLVSRCRGLSGQHRLQTLDQLRLHTCSRVIKQVSQVSVPAHSACNKSGRT
jgi:hypothetical protein